MMNYELIDYEKKQKEDKKRFIETLQTEAPEGIDLKVGDWVEWENDYGAVFRHQVLGFDTETEFNKDYERYVHLDKDSYWMPHDHRTLRKVDGPIAPGQDFVGVRKEDLPLQNGTTAKFLEVDFWGRDIYRIDLGEKEIRAVMVDGALHSVSEDGEPIMPLREEFQQTKEPSTDERYWPPMKEDGDESAPSVSVGLSR